MFIDDLEKLSEISDKFSLLVELLNIDKSLIQLEFSANLLEIPDKFSLLFELLNVDKFPISDINDKLFIVGQNLTFAASFFYIT